MVFSPADLLGDIHVHIPRKLTHPGRDLGISSCRWGR